MVVIVRHFGLACCFLLCSWICTFGVANDDFAKFKKQIIETHSKITNIEVMYRATGYDDSFEAGSYVFRHIKYTRRGDFFHFTAHGHDNMNYEDDLKAQLASSSGGEWTHSEVINRRYRRYDFPKGGPLPGSMPQEFYLQATGIWPMNRPKPDLDFTLTGILENSDYVFQEKTVLRQGRKCNILFKPNHEKIYVDLSLNGAIIERVRLSSGKVIQRIVLENHQDFGDGIWLPRRILNYFANGNEIDSATQPGIADIEKCEINNPMENDGFPVKFLPGGFISDQSGHSTTLNGLDKHLDQAFSWYRQTKAVQHSTDATVDFSSTFTILVAALFGFFAGKCVSPFIKSIF